MLPVLFDFGYVKIQSYGFFIALGFIFANILFSYLSTFSIHQNVVLKQYDVSSFLNHLFIIGFVSARLMYVLLHPVFFWNNFLEIFFIWKGGLVSYGGLIGVFFASLIWKYKNSVPLKNVYVILDCLTLPFIIAHFFGRIGCFFAGCCYGMPTGGLFSITFDDVNSLAPFGVSLHPVQLYEASYLFFLGIMILLLKYKKQLYHGEIFSTYLYLYFFGRFFLDFFRGDYRIGLFTDGQVFSVVFLSILYFFRKIKLKYI